VLTMLTTLCSVILVSIPIFPTCVVALFETVNDVIRDGEVYDGVELRATLKPREGGTTANRLNDHITKTVAQGAKSGTLNDRMRGLSQFFLANQAEIKEALDGDENTVTRHGWRRSTSVGAMPTAMVEVSTEFWPDIYNFACHPPGCPPPPGTAHRIFVNFRLVDSRVGAPYWIIAHWGPFSAASTLNPHDDPIGRKVGHLISGLEGALNSALEVIRTPGSHDVGGRLDQAIQALNDINLPGLPPVDPVQQHLDAQTDYTLSENFVPQPGPHQLLGAIVRGDDMTNIKVLEDIIHEVQVAIRSAGGLDRAQLQKTLNAAIAAVHAPESHEGGLGRLNSAIDKLNGIFTGLQRVPPAQQLQEGGEVQNVILQNARRDLPFTRSELSNVQKEDLRKAIAAITAAPQPPQQQATVSTAWGRKPSRRKRSNAPEKELGARLNIIDADPDSEFRISKIEFKELYGDQMETHVVDFERKAFVPDPCDSGSQLTTEFRVNDEVVPSTVDQNPVTTTTYKIVLKPRGQ